MTPTVEPHPLFCVLCCCPSWTYKILDPNPSTHTSLESSRKGGSNKNGRPKKRFWWGPIGSSKTKNSLVLGLLKDIYGEHNDEKIIIRIFNDQNNEYKELIYSSDAIKKMNYRIDLEKESLINVNKFGMYTVFSKYPGFFVYSLTEYKEGSIAIEHGF